MPSIQVADIFKLLPDWELHYNTFEDYKINGIQPDYFGRDTTLSYPYVHHIHLAQTQELADEWASRKAQIHQIYYRTTRRSEPENDYRLIYAYDELVDVYLLLTIIGLEAHKNEKWRSYLNQLYINIVEPWIQGRL